MRIPRREFLQTGALASLSAMAVPLSAASTYRVGVGRDSNGYVATTRALDACGEWPGPAVLAGRTVVIKPNLVAAMPSITGATTDPEVVRAIVDRALADGARAVAIVETSPQGAHFTECGYDYFASYDAHNRVALIDLQAVPSVDAPVPDGMAYASIVVPEFLLRSDMFFISVGKLKTHGEAVATLCMKNLFGLPAVNGYISWPPKGRFGMHDRGVSQTIIDLNRLRPCDFAVLDGIWGMEGLGPLAGTPVSMNTVLAGRNAVAVDRVGAAAMGLGQYSVQHLTYASRFGLGPASLSSITVAGDSLTVRPFEIPVTPPMVEYPRVLPRIISSSQNGTASIICRYSEPCLRTIEIVKLYSDVTQMDVIRTLASPTQIQPAGYETVVWDGQTEGGGATPPGVYAAHVRAYSIRASVRHADAVGWIIVSG